MIKPKLFTSFIFFYSLLITHYSSFSQAPVIDWQNTIGGSGDDLLLTINKTSDGGCIGAGFSNSSISGDKTENGIGSYDMWIVKTDVDGNIEWQNTIGGFADDVANSIEQTLDGGYIVAGYSGSGATGDKTEPLIGEYDMWVLKLDATGNIVWQNTIGGIKNDQAVSVRQTLDAGYIVGGFSHSPISGDKTEGNFGPATTSDYWVLKLDASGIITWQRTLGGDYYDYFYTLTPTLDGGYIVGGYSQSGISGNKSEALIGAADYWIVKLNFSGNTQWQNTIGGTGSDLLREIIATNDLGYLLAGYSSSDISGDKTENSFGIATDYWIVKLNSSGNIVWQNDIGGNEDDILFSADESDDGGFILGGTSYSGISGDKTEPSNGGSDYWVVKVSSTGAIEWQNSIGGNTSDEGRGIVQLSAGGYAVGGFSKSGISGDKTEVNMGPASTYDYWIVKLFQNCIPATETCNSFDDNCNGIIDDGIVETVSITPGGATTFCQGGFVMLTATYSGASVQWARNGINITGETSAVYTVTQKGNYTCTTSSICGSATSTPIAVVVNKNPPATITPDGPTVFCAGGSVLLTANAGDGLSYQWYKGASIIAGATSINYLANTTGNYKCRVTKTATGCYKNSNSIAVSVPCREGSTTDEQPIGNRFEIYPNPNNGTFTISYEAGTTSPFEGG
ncbi:MAG: immunoglobulin domain-containing protein, partial [Chitinophagales bacterium]